jgi:CheY-like chemotaxis protein
MSLLENNETDTNQIPSLKILVADDDQLNQRLMKILLTREGHDVHVVSNGLEAFDAVKFQRFDMVLMDLRMPVMDGMEASRRIREWENGGPRTFIVALTAGYVPEEGQKLFEVGIDNYIPKPFQIDHIHRLLKYSTASHPPPSSSQKVSFPPKLSSREILDIQNGIENFSDD